MGLVGDRIVKQAVGIDQSGKVFWRSEDVLKLTERRMSGTAWTYSKEFDKDGYYVVKDMWDPNELYHPPIHETGCYEYFKNGGHRFFGNEGQVEGSLSRYNVPIYKRIHNKIRHKVQEIIGRKLYNTYYFDRFYFPGTELEKHIDRDSCEISVSIHIGTNLKEPWPFYIKTPDEYFNSFRDTILNPGEERAIILEPGDGVIYKGCERPHWRKPMPSNKESWFSKKEKVYYHQIFFHYVLQDGQRVYASNDTMRIENFKP